MLLTNLRMLPLIWLVETILNPKLEPDDGA